jgi:hypothetical protein
VRFETWFNSSHKQNLLNIPGFSLFRHDRASVKKSKGGGVALYIMNGMKAEIIFKSRANAIVEYLFAEISCQNGTKVAFGVVYNPPCSVCLDPFENLVTDLCERTRMSS